MKRILLFAFCALFVCEAGARTLYVDARRPNNNGNGRSLRKAKCTIQAAVNIAKTGDTILVYPGFYGGYPGNNEVYKIWTNNKKVKIRATAGTAKTEFLGDLVLGKTRNYKGKNTKLQGFHILKDSWGGRDSVYGGTMTSCVFTRCEGENASFNRCKFDEDIGSFSESKFYNCLFERGADLTYSTLVNCTIVNDESYRSFAFLKAFNTVFFNVPVSQFKKSQHNKLRNCYRGMNPGFIQSPTYDDIADEYKAGNYRLKKGSPCINKGKLTKTQKKVVGSKDLAGKKRIRGKSVDIGCYEY